MTLSRLLSIVINLILFISFTGSLLTILIGLIGGTQNWLINRNQQTKIPPSRNWKKIFVWGTAILILTIVMYVLINVVAGFFSISGPIEEKGKVYVEKRVEVQNLYQKYGERNVSVKALDIKLVQDISFIKQLDPKFENKTGCIIVVQAGNEGYVYQEDKDLNVLYFQTLAEFKEKTKNLDQKLLEKFYSSLK